MSRLPWVPLLLALVALLPAPILTACSSSTKKADRPDVSELEIDPEEEQYRQIALSPRPSHVPRLREGISSPNEQIRLYSVRALGELTPTDMITPIYMLSTEDPSPVVAAEARDAFHRYPSEDRERVIYANDRILQSRVEDRDARIARRFERVDRKMERMTPPVDQQTMDEWVSADSGDVDFAVEAIELVRDHAPIGHPFGYNGEANAGELAEYRITLSNQATAPRLSSSAYVYSYDPYVTVINRELPVPPLEPNQAAPLQRTLLLLIDAEAPEEHEVQLYIEVGDSELDALNDGQPVYRQMPPIAIRTYGFGPVRFQLDAVDDDVWGNSDGNANGVPNWGEQVELRIGVRNLGSLEMQEARMRVYSQSALAEVVSPEDALEKGTVPPGRRPGFARTFALRLAEEYDSGFRMPLLVEMIVPFRLSGETRTSRRFIGDFEDRAAPDAVFVFRQKLILQISETGHEWIGRPTSFDPFDLDTLVRVFVVNSDPEAQELFLINQELRFTDNRESLFLD